MSDWTVTALGFVAGLLSTASFVPQVLKAWRAQDTEGISKRMYMVNMLSFTLWTGYGVLIASLPVVVFNVLCLGLSGTILFLTLRHSGGERPGVAPQ